VDVDVYERGVEIVFLKIFYIKIIFFLFKKNIFDISILK